MGNGVVAWKGLLLPASDLVMGITPAGNGSNFLSASTKEDRLVMNEEGLFALIALPHCLTLPCTHCPYIRF